MAERPEVRRRYLDPATLQKVGALELIARKAVEGLRVGLHRSPLRGFSTEFAQHRPYVAGDNLRDLDWRLYARSQRYYVKLYEAETNFAANLLFDASSSMRFASGPLSKLEYAKYLAASLAYLMVKQRDSVGLAVFDSALREYLPPKSSLDILLDIVTELEGLGTEPRTDVAAILHDFARRMTRRGVVVLFSDLLSDVDAFLLGLEHLRFRGHNVIVFHVLDPHELTFPLSGVWKFKGLERDGELIVQPPRIREAYLRELRGYLGRVKSACDRSQVEYVLADTSKPVGAVLSRFLGSRMRVRGFH